MIANFPMNVILRSHGALPQNDIMLLLASFPQEFRSSNDQERRRNCCKNKKNFSFIFCSGKRNRDPEYSQEDKIQSKTSHVVLHCFL